MLAMVISVTSYALEVLTDFVQLLYHTNNVHSVLGSLQSVVNGEIGCPVLAKRDC